MDTKKTQGRIHVVGIGGVGMSAIAQAYLDRGAEVTGSDRTADHGDVTETVRALMGQGVRVFSQDGSGVCPETAKVVVSTAIEADNPDLLAAKRLGIPVLHRSAALEEVVSGHRLVAVAGTSGKSTTTALLGWLLAGTGFDPMVVDGAAVVGWDNGGRRVGSVREGSGGWCVFEADESDKSCLRYHPDYAIITNESADHFGMEETHALFEAFAANVSREVVRDLPPPDAVLPLEGWGGRFRFHGIDFSVPLPGAHNVSNAWQAVRLASLLGADDTALARALASFPGVCRRLEKVGEAPLGAAVFDDYGHNPAKLSAAMSAIRAAFGRMAVVWRPHGYAPLRHMLEPLADAFAASLRPGDWLGLLPVYDAGGTTDRSINSDALLRALEARGVRNAGLVADISGAREALAQRDGPGAALLVCGARDPDLPRLARSLAA